MQPCSKTAPSLRTLNLLPLKRGQVGTCLAAPFSRRRPCNRHTRLFAGVSCNQTSRVLSSTCALPGSLACSLGHTSASNAPQPVSSWACWAHNCFHLQRWACSKQPRHIASLQLPLSRAQAGQWAGERGLRMTRCSSRLLEHFRRQQALPRWACRCLCQQLHAFLCAEANLSSLFSRLPHLQLVPPLMPAGYAFLCADASSALP